MGPEQVQDALRRRYAAVAERPAGQFNYPVGRDSPERLNYRRDLLDRIPSDVVATSSALATRSPRGSRSPGGTFSTSVAAGARLPDGGPVRRPDWASPWRRPKPGRRRRLPEPGSTPAA